MTIERLCYLRFVRVRLLTAFRSSSQRPPSQISLSLSLSLSRRRSVFSFPMMIKKTTVTKKWRTTQKDGKVVSENFNQKRTKKSKKYATKKKRLPSRSNTTKHTRTRIHKIEAGVFCSDIFERCWARSIRSDENVSEDHTRE
jgi:hypothetical protein